MGMMILSLLLCAVDCRELINQTLESGSKLADQMKPFHERKILSELFAGSDAEGISVERAGWP